MKLVVDSSAFAKRYVDEDGSEDIDLFMQRASDLALCIILVPEIISGLNRRLREGFLSKRNYRKAKTQLLDDVHDASVIQLTPCCLRFGMAGRSLYNIRSKTVDCCKKCRLLTEFIGHQI